MTVGHTETLIGMLEDGAPFVIDAVMLHFFLLDLFTSAKLNLFETDLFS